VADIPGIAGLHQEDRLEGKLLKLVRLAEYASDCGFVDSAIWAL
jgi:hypothetical protein